MHAVNGDFEESIKKNPKNKPYTNKKLLRARMKAKLRGWVSQ